MRYKRLGTGNSFSMKGLDGGPIISRRIPLHHDRMSTLIHPDLEKKLIPINLRILVSKIDFHSEQK